MLFFNIKEQSSAASAPLNDFISSVLIECIASYALMWHYLLLLSLDLFFFILIFLLVLSFINNSILFGFFFISLTIEAGPMIVKPPLFPSIKFLILPNPLAFSSGFIT